MSDKLNPCDCCPATQKASGCDCCVLHTITTSGECNNDKCFVNYECGCLLSLDNVCKASTAYEYDYTNHVCGECTHRFEKADKYGVFVSYYCDLTDDQACDIDTACEQFEEREVD